ncbi:bifunctional metallophosphatase/5'-nucleotidase [Nocardioides pacificus]
MGLSLVAAPLTLVVAPAQAADPVEIQVLGINDFHGRILPNFGSRNLEGGAAVLAGAVDQLESEHPNSVFAAAGDLIGASTFESFIAQDKPTIDALNAAGLDVSAAGNHEFDQGYDDLINRVMAPESAENPYGGANWEYIAANVKMKASGNPALDPTYVQTFGTGESAVDVGFVGAVTEDLPSLVSPAGIEDLQVTDIVAAVNAEATALAADGVEIIVLLVHEGATDTSLASATDAASKFGKIVNGVNTDVDAIISGHTHKAYNHAVPVPAWVTEGRAVTTRPVVSAGQYGMNLNQLLFDVDPATGDLVSLEQNILPLVAGGAGAYPADADVETLVAEAKAEADVLGAEPLGELAGPLYLARVADGTVSRGGESTVGNLVAEIQRWATEAPTFGGAQIAFMNPGGLREDMVGLQDSDPATPLEFPATLTYKQAATAQPFANTLVNMGLTGAQIESVLEEQWQPAGSSRPFLKLGTSKGFEYTYDAAAQEITGMWLNGTPVQDDVTYSVTVNSFLASGGDNFATLAEGSNPKDTGRIDLSAVVDYMDTFASETPLPVDYAQHAVGVSFPAEAPASYSPGDTVAFDLSSLAFTGPADVRDDAVEVLLQGKSLGTFAVDNTIGTAQFDEHGTASIEAVLPRYAGDPDSVTVVGAKTGTKVEIPIATKWMPKLTSVVKVTRSPKKVYAKKTRPTMKVQVSAEGEQVTGWVKVRTGGNQYVRRVVDGVATLKVGPYATRGVKRVVIRYTGNAMTKSSRKIAQIFVRR